jgi:hypothetical protein
MMFEKNFRKEGQLLKNELACAKNTFLSASPFLWQLYCKINNR